jgi:hypothetical protein
MNCFTRFHSFDWSTQQEGPNLSLFCFQATVVEIFDLRQFSDLELGYRAELVASGVVSLA